MNYFPELQYRFQIVTPAGTATIDFPETQWDVAAQAAIIGPGAATVKDYLSVHGIGFYGRMFDLDAVSPMDLHHALLMNATTHHEPAIFRFDVIGYVPTENPAENDPDRWRDEEEQENDLILEAADNGNRYEPPVLTDSRFARSGNKPNDFITVSGQRDWWILPILSRKKAGELFPPLPIRLANGQHFGKSKGYGLDHIIKSHPEILKQNISVELYIYSLLHNVSKIYDPSRENKLVLQSVGRPSGTIFIQLKEERGFYSIVTVFNGKPEGELVWSGRTVDTELSPVPNQIHESATTSKQSACLPSLAAQGNETFVPPIPPLEGLEVQTIVLNQDILSSSDDVKKEDIVTESATFDYRTAIMQATNFDDIQAAFQKAFPIIIPANLPAKASGINLLDNGKGKPNTVYRDIYDLYTYEHLGLISEPYDGTLESLMVGWEKVQQRLNDYHNASNSNSPIAATDAGGRAKYYVSPNGRIIRDLQTGEEINTDAYRERDAKKELQDQGFIVDTNVDGAIVSLRLAGNIALRDRYGRWKLYEGEQDEKNLIGDDFTQSEVVKEMKGMILESADREAIASGRFFTEGELRAMARRLKERDRTKADNFHKRLKAKLGQADAPTADLESSKSTIEPWQIKKAEFIVLQNNLLPDWEPGIGFYGGYEFAMPDKTTRRFDGPVYTKNLAIEVFHRESVSMAMQMGLPVPPVVLEDYPELVENVLESALTAEEIHDIAHQAATSHKNDLPEPTEAQAKAGNYKHGHLKLYGLDITIENPAGSKRSGIDPDGKPWECVIPAHYGFFKRTMGSDGDHVDCYIGESPESELVFIVDQMDLMTGCFDEHKTLLACQSEEEARNIYIAGFSDGKGPDRIGAITEMDMEEFKVWLAEGETTQPVGRITIPQI